MLILGGARTAGGLLFAIGYGPLDPRLNNAPVAGRGGSFLRRPVGADPMAVNRNLP